MSVTFVVHGGSDRVDVQAAELLAVARQLEGSAHEASESLYRVGSAGRHPGLLGAAAADPFGAATVAAATGAAVVALGLVEVTARGLAVALRAAVAGYQRADQLGQDYAEIQQALAGLPAAAGAAAHELVSGVPAGAWSAAVRADPELPGLPLAVLGAGLGSAGGPPAGHRWQPLPAWFAVGLAAVLAEPYTDGRPVVTARRGATGDPTPPRTVDDLLRGVALRSADNHGGGAVDVRFLTRHSAAGHTGRVAVVDLTGTTRWNIDPRQPTPQASDFSADLRALGNRSTSYERGVLAAMEHAGIRPGEPVMLVGHSLGGLIAARLAADPRTRARFHITHVVTAGAPIGLAAIPPDVQVLALENRDDLVPRLDTRANPARPTWITVAADPTPATHPHSLAAYRQVAVGVDSSDHPALRHWRESAVDFLGADSVDNRVYEIRRR